MEVLIECIFVPARDDLPPAQVVGTYTSEDSDDTLDVFMKFLDELRGALATEVGVTPEFLPAEGTFFRINVRP